jgi:hypothetical protein
VHSAIGVEAGEEMLRLIWESEFSAVAGDMPAFEALPFQSTTHWMHEWLLAGWGLPIGELFDLEKLAVECKPHNKWSFFFSSVPLKVSPVSISVNRANLISSGSWRCCESTKRACNPVALTDIKVPQIESSPHLPWHVTISLKFNLLIIQYLSSCHWTSAMNVTK